MSLQNSFIFLSPSKTQRSAAEAASERVLASPAFPTRPLFEETADKLSDELSERSPEYFRKTGKLSEKMTAQVHALWACRSESPELPVVSLYNGPAFTALDYLSLDFDGGGKYSGQGKRLRIFSALYGMLRPFDLVRPYRLDFSYRDLQVEDMTLPQYWKRRIREHFESSFSSQVSIDGAGSDTALPGNSSPETDGTTVFVDLSSSEFSPLIPSDLAATLRIDFREKRGGQWRSISATSKKMRGLCARWLLQAGSKNLGDLFHADIDGYRINPALCSGNLYVFSPKNDME